MSGHLGNVRQSWTQDGKPDSMIVERETGPVARPFDGPVHVRQIIFNMTVKERQSWDNIRTHLVDGVEPNQARAELGE